MYGHASKSRTERNTIIKDILDKKEEPTIQTTGNGTLDDFEEQAAEYDLKKQRRKYSKNRLIIHIRETWPNYVISVIGILGFFFFITLNIKMAEINKDISFLNYRLDDNTRKMEIIYNEISSLKEKVSENMQSFQSELKLLDGRFAMFIELFNSGSK
jgi:hypothetical protein